MPTKPSIPLLRPDGTARAALGLGGDREGLPFPHGREGNFSSRDLSPELLFLCWELCRRWGPKTADRARAAFELTVATQMALAQGDTCLSLEAHAHSRLQALLEATGTPITERPAVLALARELQASIPNDLDALVGTSEATRPLIVQRDGTTARLYIQRIHAAEQAVVTRLRARLNAPPEATAAEIVNTGDLVLDPLQASAVAAALSRPLTLITGGPGTGKTTVVAAIVASLLRSGVAPSRIALAAPTGKAANRLGEALSRQKENSPNQPVPATLHRLLGYRPAAAGGTASFQHHTGRPLPFSYVIVDEASMIDLFLMDALLAALAPQTRLILLGDEGQLPPVESGDVLTALAPHSHRLARSFRMSTAHAAGRALLDLAEQIRSGTLAPETIPTRDGAAIAFEGVERIDSNKQSRSAFFNQWHDRIFTQAPGILESLATPFAVANGHIKDVQRAQALLSHFESRRILCITRGYLRDTGAEAVNLQMLRRFERAHLGQAGRPIKSHWTLPGADLPSAPRAGLPVIMGRNDYERGLWNGDPGVIVSTPDEGWVVAFARGAEVIAAPFEAVAHDLALGFALTVHRAQGSEMNEAALILPDDDLPLLTREILYTALTRCRRSVLIVGSPELLRLALERPQRRLSGLALGLGTDRSAKGG